MAKVRRAYAGSSRPPAGKHPTRRPSLQTEDASRRASDEEEKRQGEGNAIMSTVDDAPSSSAAKARSTTPPSSHLMTTRLRAKKAFRLLELPAELRNRIYAFAVRSEEPLPLRDFKRPSLVFVSRQLRAEVSPVFFASNVFTATIRSNWCVFARHWHTAQHLRFNQTGVVSLSPLLAALDFPHPRQARLPPQLAEYVVRFHQVKLRIDCCCCTTSRQIGALTLDFRARPKVQYKTTSTDILTELNMLLPELEVAKEILRINMRARFNGFTVQDLQDLAKCFKHDKAATADHRGD